MQLPFIVLQFTFRKKLKKSNTLYTILIKPVVKYGTNTSLYNNIHTVQRIRSQRDVGNFILNHKQAEWYEIQYVNNKKAKLSGMVQSASIPRRQHL